MEASVNGNESAANVHVITADRQATDDKQNRLLYTE
jgi:hypothetical protein